MAQQIIDIGTVPGDDTGDVGRVGGDKINDNFTELYNHLEGWTKHTADSVTVDAGNEGASVVADLQTKDDLDYFHIDEVTAAPGIDLIVDFVNVAFFNRVKIAAHYDGTAAHAGLAIQLYNWVSLAWDNYGFLYHHGDIGTPAENMVNCDLFVPDPANYIGAGVDADKVRVRMVHAASGNPSHDFDVDVVVLYQ